MNKYKKLRERARALRNDGYSLNKIVEKLSIPKTTVYYWIRDLPRPGPDKIRRRTWTDEQFVNAVQENISVAGVLKSLNLGISGANYGTIYKNVQRLNLDTSHWLGQAWARGKHHGRTYRKPLSEVLVEHSTYSRGWLKYRLIDESILKNECSKCGLGPWWKEESLVMVLDHKNGIRDDNRLKNLRFLCPNCNSQTETFTGRNVGTYG